MYVRRITCFHVNLRRLFFFPLQRLPHFQPRGYRRKMQSRMVIERDFILWSSMHFEKLYYTPDEMYILRPSTLSIHKKKSDLTLFFFIRLFHE